MAEWSSATNPLATPDGLVAWVNGRRTVGSPRECLLSQYIYHVTRRRACVDAEAWWFRTGADLIRDHRLPAWARAVVHGFDTVRGSSQMTLPGSVAREIVATALCQEGLDASGVRR